VVIIIYIIWFIWFLNSVFNMIIMLNFMISIVQASYQRVMASRNQYMFEYKSDLNQEVGIFKSIFMKTNSDVDAIIILTKSDKNLIVDPNQDENKGLLNAMKQEIKKVMDNQAEMI